MSSKVLCYTNQSDGSLDICISCGSCELPESQSGWPGRDFTDEPVPAPALGRDTFHQTPLLAAPALGTLTGQDCSSVSCPAEPRAVSSHPNLSCCSSPGAGRAARGRGRAGPSGSIGSSSLGPGGHGPVQQQAQAAAQPAQPGDRCPHIGDPDSWAMHWPGTALPSFLCSGDSPRLPPCLQTLDGTRASRRLCGLL